MKKLKNFWKKNKKKIITIAGITAGGVAAVVIGKRIVKKAFNNVQVEVPVKCIPLKREDIPEELAKMDVTPVRVLSPKIDQMFNKTTTTYSDCKKLVESMSELPGVTDDSKAVVSILIEEKDQ